jgi:hypothetical protein
LKPFSLKEYQLLITKSETLEKDRHGVKVLLTPEGRIVKFFRQKRLMQFMNYLNPQGSGPIREKNHSNGLVDTFSQVGILPIFIGVKKNNQGSETVVGSNPMGGSI